MKQLMKSGGILILLLIVYAQIQAQHINSLNPADPVQGEAFEIIGSGFEQQQGPWVVEVARVVHRQMLSYHFRVLRWRTDRILVEVPADIPANEYGVQVRIPNRLKGSNGVRLTIRERPANQPPPSLVPWIRRAHVTGQFELWIYGQHFGEVGGGLAKEIPHGGRVHFSGNGRDEDLGIVRWLDNLVRVWLPQACEPGSYRVVVFSGRGTGRANESNSMSVLVRPEMINEANPGLIEGFMHIDSVEPMVIARGTPFTILGDHFDVYRKGKNNSVDRVGQGDRIVELVEIHKGHASSHICNVQNLDPRLYPENLHTGPLQWFNDHISAIAPGDLNPGPFLLRLRDKADNRSSNNIAVRVVMNAGEALSIETISPNPALPGSELTIRGRNFGEAQGSRVAILNPGHLRLQVRDWSPDELRLVLPQDLTPGRYSLRIFEDAALTEGSDLYTIQVARSNLP
jgi:hypothetical protein